MVEEVPGGVFTQTFHPQSIGCAARLCLLERMIHRGKEHGAEFRTVSDAVSAWQGAAPSRGATA